MSERPAFIRHVSELPDNGGTVWAGSDEVLSIRTPLSRPLGLQRIGVHHEVLEPGHRSSLPHSEPLEEECVYVLEGRPCAWIDGESHRLGPDDIVVFAPGTGIRHTIVNDGESPVRLLVIGERIVVDGQTMIAFAHWLVAEHADRLPLTTCGSEERLALANAFEQGGLDDDEGRRQVWQASLGDNALSDRFDWPGYAEARRILRSVE
jgi:uncharacterized cupin superfamily protein